MNDLSLGTAEVDAYLDRIGVPRTDRPDVEYLRRLHRAHLHAVPFENLSVHLGEDIVLTPGALVDKLVGAGRGGFCYELNGAFAALLASLGYRVALLAARVHAGERGFGPPFDHLALRVEVPGSPEPWLVDVGFGQHIELPLRYDERGEQHDPAGVFRIEETADGDLDVYHDGKPAYRMEQRPRTLADFEMACWWQRTSPKSHFTRSLVCSLLTGEGRVTLSGRTLVTTDNEGNRKEEELPEDAVVAAYREHFGITVEEPPAPRSFPEA